MERVFGPLGGQVALGEFDKFEAPIVLLHGLWEDASMWRGFTSFLSNRGWRCIALDLRAGASSLRQHVDDLRAALAAVDGRPVLLGHDLGGRIALHLGDAASAIVAMNPIVSPPLQANVCPQIRRAQGFWRRRGGSPVAAPTGDALHAYGARAVRATESGELLRELGRPVTLEPVLGVPVAVFAGRQDPITPVDAGRRLAETLGAEFFECDGGHSLPTGAEWTQRAAEVHRWLVRRLGAANLLLYEEGEDPTEEDGD